MAFPQPPKSKPAATPVPASPPVDSCNGRLDDDVVSMVLRKNLLPIHHEDPNVLRFISNFIRCRDYKQAAVEANLTPQSGYNLRMRPDIYKTITELTELSVAKYGFDAADVIERVKEISALDPVELLNPDGSYKKMQDIAPETRRAIKKMKVKNLFEKDPNGMPVLVGEIIEVEFWDKLKAHELLGREKEVFKEKKVIEHDVTKNMASILLDAQSRAEQRLSQDLPPTLEIQGRIVNEETSSS